jgi:hypothetical protein
LWKPGLWIAGLFLVLSIVCFAERQVVPSAILALVAAAIGGVILYQTGTAIGAAKVATCGDTTGGS